MTTTPAQIPTGDRRDEIQIYDLHKSFGQIEVLKGISTIIRRGEVVCVIGPSGSGKSTLLRCVNMLEEPTSGRIFIINEEITDPDADVDAIRTKMGMVFQSFNLFPHLTVLQNCTIGPIAVKQEVTQPYKPSTWAQVPDWAKDKDGHWALAYTGTIAFIVNKKLLHGSEVPTTWADLQTGKYKVSVGDVSTAAQASNAVLAAAIANKGDEKNIAPGLQFFTKIAQQGRLSLSNPTIATMEKGEVEVGIVWDFNGLSYKAKMANPDDYVVLIPSDGSVKSGYTTIINKYAKHPNAAKLTREYIFSDAGQLNLARGNARPIRAETDLKLPADVAKNLIPGEQYTKANPQPIKDADAWEATSKKLPQMWNEQVIVEMK